MKAFVKKNKACIFAFICIIGVVGIFFRQTIVSGKLPVPTDTLVGMYHPWLDAIAEKYPSGLPYKNFLITDPVRQQIPWRKIAIDQLKEGRIAAWNPYSFAGMSLSDNIQSGFYYPGNILFFLFSFPVAWSMLIIIQPLLAGFFFFIFLHKSMHLDFSASLFGTFLYMFCGFSTVWLTWGTIGQTFLWLPAALFLIDCVLSSDLIKRKAAMGVLLSLVFVMQYFAGHSQIFVYCMGVCVLYAILGIWRRNRKKTHILILVGACLVALSITSIHWIPFISAYGSVSRLQAGSSFQGQGFFIPFEHLIQFLIPDFFGNPATLNYWGVWNYAEFSGYIGIAGLLFAGIAIWVKEQHIRIFWIIVGIGSLFLALPFSVSMIPYTLHIPFISSMQPTRLLSLVDFSLCILSAIGFEFWMKSPNKKPVWYTIVFFSGIFIILWLAVNSNVFAMSEDVRAVTLRNLIFPTGIAAGIIVVIFLRWCIETIIGKSSVFVKGAIICIIGISLYDVFRFGWKFTPFTDPSLFFPTTSTLTFLSQQQKPFRIVAVDDRIMPPNVYGYYGIEAISGYDPLYQQRYEIYIAAMERGEPNIAPPYGFNRIITPKNITSPLFKLLDVRYILSLSDIEDETLTKVFQEGQTRVYEYTNAVPRVYLAQSIAVEKSPQQIFTRMYDPSFVPGKDAIVEEEIQIDPQQLLSDHEAATVSSYTDYWMEIFAVIDVPRLLCIGNVYDSRWKAFVDGKPASIVRVNYIFMGINLDKPGNHTIRIIYE